MGDQDDFQDVAFQKAMKDFWKECVENKSDGEIAEAVEIFKIQKPKIPSKVVVREFQDYARMTYRFRPSNPLQQSAELLQAHMTRVMREKGWQVLSGSAPKSMNERNVQSLKDKLSKAN